ncbi:dihydrolipoyl dehydrogenase [Janibacter alkaliphilus]|uniref:Dihydrolipoyl dehydrogenase n=1 Tax=Janibacter alkaliphilus TaxID=1069963 RepID=A0A852X460_9MICO|nr:dihydrolipoamide dehydrogenase [Janibacter alkaliphilus]
MVATPDRSSDTPFDLVVLGAGSGGYACALRARQLGLTVALVEEDKIGGTCLHRGCIPTKALLHAAEVADHARHGADLGVRSTFEGIDTAALHARKDTVVGQLYKGVSGLVSQAGVEVVAGRGRLTGPGTVEVTAPDGATREVAGRHVVLATGSYARTLPGITLGPRVMTSDQAISIESIPERTIVLGGGVIGVEFASMLASFGSQVTVVEALDRLVPAEEPALSTQLQRAYRKRGSDVRTSVSVAGVTEHEDRVVVEIEGGDPLEAELLLVAVGRGPRTEGIGLEEVGVETDRGFVVTDERCATSVPGVLAVGDIVPGLQLAHRGFAQGIFAAEEIGGLQPQPVQDSQVPRVTYSDPEVASVGLTTEQATAAGVEVEQVTYPLGGNGRSVIRGTSGQVIVLRAKEGPVVGVHMIGLGVSELIAEAQVVVGWEAHPEDVAPLVHAHPTQGEALGEAAMLAAGRPLHAHA